MANFNDSLKATIWPKSGFCWIELVHSKNQKSEILEVQSCSFEIEQGPFYAVNDHFSTKPDGYYAYCYAHFIFAFN